MKSNILVKTQADVDETKTNNERLLKINDLEIYLSSTDWYATRFAETGKAIPDEVITKRNAARERISELRVKE